MEFVSNARYNEDVNDGTIYRLKDNKLGVCIHKIHGCGNNWYMNCTALNLSDENLRTEGFADAVEKTKHIIDKYVIDIRNEYEKFYKDESIEIVRY